MDRKEVYDSTEKPKFMIDSLEGSAKSCQGTLKRNSCPVQINTRRQGASKGNNTVRISHFENFEKVRFDLFRRYVIFLLSAMYQH